ncbi:hypothetical protein KEM48_008640 [Puccinia striiformis f. sp. tritici PST-130]|nr:hypothetical protein KEM48_008640 [Puccinia striiformis f. sp. tritici PST-130]
MDINQDERVQNLAEALTNLQINHQSGQDRSESIVAEINSMKLEITSLKLSLQDVTQRLLIFHHQLANVQNIPPPPPPTQQVFADVAVMTASTGFTFPLYQAICIKNKLCQRCHKVYDKTHITNRSCPNVEVTIKEKIDLYSRLSRGQLPTPLAEINLSSINTDGPVQSWDTVGIDSFADMLMFGADENGNIIEQGELSFSIASLSTSLPLPPILLFPPLPIQINLDLLSPSNSSFLDSPLSPLWPSLTLVLEDRSSTKNSSFDGSPATSGDVTHYWSGQITGSDFLNHSKVSNVSLNVVSLSSVDVILGLPWLKANLAWVGGPYGQLFFSSHSNTSNCILPISTQSLSIASITNNLVYKLFLQSDLNLI